MIESSGPRREDRSAEQRCKTDSNVILCSQNQLHVVLQVSLALQMDWVEPAFSFSREDVEPAKRVLDFRIGWFAEPIFGKGDYPLGMRSWLRQLNSLEYKSTHTILQSRFTHQSLSYRRFHVIVMCQSSWLQNMLHLNWGKHNETRIFQVSPCFHSLPVFNEEDRQLVKGTYDFFAISHFSTELVTHAKESS